MSPPPPSVHTPHSHSHNLTAEERLRLEIQETRDKLIDRSVAISDYMDRSFRRSVDQTAQRMEQCASQISKNFESSLVSTGKSLESSAYAMGQNIERTVGVVGQTIRDTGSHLFHKISLVPAVQRSPLRAFAGAAATGFVLSRLMHQRKAPPPPVTIYAPAPNPAPESTMPTRQVVPMAQVAPFALAPMALRAAGLLFDLWRRQHRRSQR